MPLLGEQMHLVRLVCLVQSTDQTRGVAEVHVLVDQAVYEQQAFVPEQKKT